MGLVLTQEATLGKQLDGLSSERRLLPTVIRLEAGLGAVFLLTGLYVYLADQSTALLWLGGFCLFLAAGHFVRIKEGEQESVKISAGRRGEQEVSAVLERELPDDEYIINDLVLKVRGQSSQVDHVVVGRRGIFVIETKHWHGLVEGTERSFKWMLRQDGRTLKVTNPVRQNARHVKILKTFLQSRGFSCPPVYNVVVFAGTRTTFYTDTVTPLLTSQNVVRWMKEKPLSRESEPAACVSILKALGVRI